MSGHTPGPWTFDKGDNYDVGSILGVDPVSGAAAVCTFGEAASCDGWGSAPGEADLALILAAPDLLGVLRDAVVCAGHDDDCPESDFDAAPETCTCWMARAKAAIAKAEGRA